MSEIDTISSTDLVLSIDAGTSSTRVGIWDTLGREVPGVKAQVQYLMRTTADGGVEMDADAWCAAIFETLDIAMQQARDSGIASHIRAVGISTFWHSMLVLGRNGDALSPIFSWADNRSAAIATKLRSQWDSSKLHSRTGCVLHPCFYPAKLSWLKQDRPELYKLAARFISPSEYLLKRLFGLSAVHVSISMASGTGLFNQVECRWDQEILELLQINEAILSPIATHSETAIGLLPDFAARWPELKDVPFYPAVGDGACGNIGSGCCSPDKLAINLGTSGAIRAVWDIDRDGIGDPELPRGIWRYRVDGRRAIAGAAFSDGGHVYTFMRETLNLPAQDETESAIAAMEPCNHGLTFMPFLAGERSMGWNPDSRASLLGMNLDTQPIHILRAAMEAVAMQFLTATESLKTMFPHVTKIVASGGALGHSAPWRTIFADVIGLPITFASEPEASSRGAALLALEGSGLIESIESVPARMGQTLGPDNRAHTIYLDHLI